MTQVVGFINQKGGVGKSTIALNTAEWLARKDNKVLILDTDPQASLYEFYIKESTQDNLKSNKINFECVFSPFKKASLENYIKQGYDYIVVDSAGSAIAEVMSTKDLFDIILLPVGVSEVDVKSTLTLRDNIRECNHYIFINRIKNVSVNKAKKLLQSFKDADIPYLDNMIGDRDIYKDSMTQGLTILSSNNDNAISEFSLMMQEIFE